LDIPRAEGGELTTTGELGHGLYMPPTLVENVGADARVVREEIFGPVASLMTFTDTEDAIAQGNDTIYGLSASVWTTNPERAHRTASGLRAGTVWINAYADMSAGTLPFGGFKQSTSDRPNECPRVRPGGWLVSGYECSSTRSHSRATCPSRAWVRRRSLSGGQVRDGGADRRPPVEVT
jgi:hypothetical protein